MNLAKLHRTVRHILKAPPGFLGGAPHLPLPLKNYACSRPMSKAFARLPESRIGQGH
jgi:hypothetical protein